MWRWEREKEKFRRKLNVCAAREDWMGKVWNKLLWRMNGQQTERAFRKWIELSVDSIFTEIGLKVRKLCLQTFTIQLPSPFWNKLQWHTIFHSRQERASGVHFHISYVRGERDVRDELEMEDDMARKANTKVSTRMINYCFFSRFDFLLYTLGCYLCLLASERWSMRKGRMKFLVELNILTLTADRVSGICADVSRVVTNSQTPSSPHVFHTLFPLILVISFFELNQRDEIREGKTESELEWKEGEKRAENVEEKSILNILRKSKFSPFRWRRWNYCEKRTCAVGGRENIKKKSWKFLKTFSLHRQPHPSEKSCKRKFTWSEIRCRVDANS